MPSPTFADILAARERIAPHREEVASRKAARRPRRPGHRVECLTQWVRERYGARPGGPTAFPESYDSP